MSATMPTVAMARTGYAPLKAEGEDEEELTGPVFAVPHPPHTDSAKSNANTLFNGFSFTIELRAEVAEGLQVAESEGRRDSQNSKQATNSN